MTVQPAIAMTVDPFPGYARMRQLGPVVDEGPGRPRMICGHPEVESVLRDPRTFSSNLGPMMGGGMGIGGSMLFLDPPEHTALRNIVSKAFTPRSIAELEPRIRELTVDILDRIPMGEPFDIVDELAIPLPITVIAEMLGIDPADRADFKRWSNAITGLAPMSQAQLRAEFGGYFDRVLTQRRRDPRDDLISRLLAANDGDVLSVDELLAFVMLLLVAGNETTTNLIGLATLYLSHFVEQRQRLIDDPRMISNAVEEILRYDGPVHMIPPRVVTADVTIGGVDLRPSQWVMTVLAAANRDPRRYDDPDVFDVGRPDASSHVTFGAGVHFCLGAPLARLEGRIILEEMLERWPAFRLADPEAAVEFSPSPVLRTITSLPVVAA
jgi:cytochrome P450